MEPQSSIYHGCDQMTYGRLHIQGDIENNDCILLCCAPIENRPGTNFGNTAKESIANYMKLRTEYAAESKYFAMLNGDDVPKQERKHTAGCINCSQYRLSEQMWDGLIREIHIGAYPSPCQCMCIYCNLHGKYKVKETDLNQQPPYSEAFEKLLDAMEYLQKSDIVADDLRWLISCGEITVNPYRDRIFDILKTQATIYFTNGFIFNEKIATSLKRNPRSGINISIDAGMAETWHRVKGVNNFDGVLSNLAKYSYYCTDSSQIMLNYIVLPGINDSLEDYQNLVEIMKNLSIKSLWISADGNIKYSADDKERGVLIQSAIRLGALLRKNDMFFQLSESYFPNEIKMVSIMSVIKK